MAVPSPVSHLVILFVIFVLFGVLMGALFLSYVLPNACKAEEPEYLATSIPVAATATPTLTSSTPLAYTTPSYMPTPTRILNTTPYSTVFTTNTR